MKLALATLALMLRLPAANIAGNWGGSLDTQLPNGHVYNAFVYMCLTQQGKIVKGSIGESETKAWPISDGVIDHGKVSFVAHPSDVQKVRFELTRSHGRLVGEAVADRNGTPMTMKVNVARNGPVYWYIHGRSLAEGNPQNGTPSFLETEAAFRRAIKLDPKMAGSYVELGKLYLDANRPADAVPVLEKAVSLWKDYRPAYTHLATAYRRTNQPERASETLAKLQKIVSPQSENH